MREGKNKKLWINVASPVIIILLTFLFASVLIVMTGKNPVNALYQLVRGAFGTKASFINTMNKAIPISLAGFAVAFSKKAGIFNIGVEGQLIMGAFGSAIAGIYLKGLPAVIHIPIAVLAGMLFGGLYALLPVVLHIKRGANLIVLCIMMNNIAALLSTWLLVGPLAGSNAMITATDPIEQSAVIPYLIQKPNKLSAGILIVFAAAVLLWVFMEKTAVGYELKMCGANREAARYAGIHVKRYTAAALLCSGMLGGLAGSVEILGNYHRVYDGFSPGYGFDGIPIALLASGNPFGVIIGAILFGALRVGGMNMQTKAGVSTDIISVIQGMLVVLIACEAIIRFGLSKIGKSRKEALV